MVTVRIKDDGGTANAGVDTSPPQTFTITITKPHPWQNTDSPLDVNDDGDVTPLDALIVFNYLNGAGPGPVPPGLASARHSMTPRATTSFPRSTRCWCSTT